MSLCKNCKHNRRGRLGINKTYEDYYEGQLCVFLRARLYDAYNFGCRGVYFTEKKKWWRFWK